jgi:hypothetical protein
MNALDKAIERRAALLEMLPKIRTEIDRVEGFITNCMRLSTDPPPIPEPVSEPPQRSRKDAALAAFSYEWQRLGDVAYRLGGGHGNKLIAIARQLRANGLVESRFHVGYYQWRRIAIATEARRAETTGSVHDGAVPERQSPKDGSQ